MELLLFNFSAQIHFLLQITFELIHHICSSISVCLKHSELLNGLVSRHICLSNRTLVVDITITVQIHIGLQSVILTICLVFLSELIFHDRDFLADQIFLLNKVRALSVDSIELSKDQIESLLEGHVVTLELSEVFVACGTNGIVGD